MSSQNPSKTCKLRFGYPCDYPEYPKDAASRIPSDLEPADLYAVPPNCIAADSHTGFERESNEDSFLVCANPDGHNSFAAIADGVGGHLNGEIASRTCLSILFNEWCRLTETGEIEDHERIVEFLEDAVTIANNRVFHRAHELNMPEQMCTTLAAIMFAGKKIVTIHIGDSRIYRIRNGVAVCLTQDHTLVNEMYMAGTITEEEKRVHPLAHIISRSIGGTESVFPETNVFDHIPGDRYLVCSDGLTDRVNDDEIAEAVWREYEPAGAVKSLLELALRRGGTDNVSIISLFG